MPKAVANPVVVDYFVIKAFQPADVMNNPLQSRARILVEDPSAPDGTGSRLISLDPAMLSRINPVAGDYYVVQQDGYAYLNPKDVFETKYSKL